VRTRSSTTTRRRYVTEVERIRPRRSVSCSRQPAATQTQVSQYTVYTVKISVYPRIFCDIAMWARASLFRRFADNNVYGIPGPVKCGKLATKYPWIYGYFHSVRWAFSTCSNYCVLRSNLNVEVTFCFRFVKTEVVTSRPVVDYTDFGVDSSSHFLFGARALHTVTQS